MSNLELVSAILALILSPVVYVRWIKFWRNFANLDCNAGSLLLALVGALFLTLLVSLLIYIAEVCRYV